MPISIMDLAIFRLGLDPENPPTLTGADFEKASLSIMGGCARCGATLAAYNGYPSKSGYWCCKSCLGDTGWEDVSVANKEIFGEQ